VEILASNNGATVTPCPDALLAEFDSSRSYVFLKVT
jgi:hypothetical protein